MDAVFRCRHQRVDAAISWLINGSSSRLYLDVVDSFIRDSNGTRIETLTIPAIPEYNETEVVCMATFFDESPDEVTPPADLIIIVNIMGMLACRIWMTVHYACYFTLLIVDSEAETQPPPPTTLETGNMGNSMYM